jgi:hypothetical protein
MSTASAFDWIRDEKEVGYSNTPYIVYDSPNHCRCLLCLAGSMHDNVVHTHLLGHYHSSKHAKLKKVQKKVQLMLLKNEWCSQSIAPSVLKLGLERWKWYMYHLWRLYINDGTDHKRSSYLPILAACKKYSTMEKLSLLELAVWNANCLVNHTDATGSQAHSVTRQAIEDYWALGERIEAVQYS